MHRLILMSAVVLLTGCTVPPGEVTVPSGGRAVPPGGRAVPPCRFAGEHARPFRCLEVPVPHATLHVEVTGKGPPLVLVHGAADHRIFHPVLHRLGRKHMVVYWDQRGFGFTKVSEDAPQTTLATDVADLEAVREALGFSKISVLALSNGGPIAIDYALAHPDRIEKLILLDTYADNEARIALAQPLVAKVIYDAKRKAQVKALDEDLDPREREIREFLILPHTHHDRPLPRAWVTFWFESGCLGRRERPQARFRSPPSRDYSKLEQLQNVPCPTLVICGDGDRVTPLPHSRDMVKRLPNGRLVVIEGAGHMAYAEKPEAFLQAVEKFLR